MTFLQQANLLPCFHLKELPTPKSAPGTGSEFYFKPLLFLDGQLADSTCLQEAVWKYRMSPRPCDTLSPASNASNVRPPIAVSPSESDHVT